ncbi:RNA polymerase sigma factor [Phenylobacterium sp.]|uniref:RNA polymerase sigma factor n=1 Tax=Phenylobacterium sp. TaxID=1871053 RepID=UPI0025FF39E5|nr:RNA polymerase sigma factor [Phenylobacterium sp.]MBX3485601.1 RNA polymerase sigma factor [Phenylobacterium sp.]MCW5758164.1 RNA polymerase sigma factor [Phenylobacterium sp.]
MAPARGFERPGDESPLVRAFFEKRENLVLFLAARTRDMATAEDLAQDLYLKIAAQPPGDVKSPSALLYRMAGNLLIDHVRSRQRASRREGQWRMDTRVAGAEEEVAQEPAADDVVIGRERARMLAEAVAALPPKMGQAFRLHKLEGRSQAETAQAMGVSVKMVEQHISAALKNLTQKLRT